MAKKKVYFIGIAGKTMGPLAKAFKDMGWEVSGSDHKGVYPPISTYLQENSIPYVEGYEAQNVPSDANLVVVGRSALMVDPENPEYLKAKQLGLKVLSYPEVLQEYLIKDKSIVVAGTYGKTTISAVLAWILINAGLNPSYMTGGVPLNMEDGVKITDADYSVAEGDEPPALWETDPPKFMFYRPKYLVLTATLYDHPEIFKTEEAYREAFVRLVKLLPADGLLVYNLEMVSPAVVEAAPGQKISYSLTNQKADYRVEEIKSQGEKTAFVVQSKKEEISLETVLLGKHNLENLCAAVAMSLELGIAKEAVTQAVATFKGIKTRLEFLGKAGGRFWYWDLAQHPQKIKGSLAALRENFPQKKILCIFDPAMTGLKYKESLAWYPGAFDAADQVIVGQVSFLKKISKEERVTGKDIIKAISQTQKNVFYEPVDEKLVERLKNETKEGEVIVFMSSGGLRFSNLIERVVQCFKDGRKISEDN
jgi:UDP-N-acetylmuramate: L-alanyl-gamma-D-glutamyl-meso-diaminopimelate ligase